MRNTIRYELLICAGCRRRATKCVCTAPDATGSRRPTWATEQVWTADQVAQAIADVFRQDVVDIGEAVRDRPNDVVSAIVETLRDEPRRGSRVERRSGQTSGQKVA